MYLFFHINATGRPKKWSRPASDTFFWPRLIQIAWQEYDEKKQLISSENFIIKPEGFEISEETEDYTKITPDRAREEGVDLEEVLQKFSKLVDKCKYIVAHNTKLAANVVEAEFIRKGKSSRLFSSELMSLMQEATYFCKIVARGGTKYKWPSLQEVHKKCYDVKFADAYDAGVSVQALSNCFFHLVEEDEIDIF